MQSWHQAQEMQLCASSCCWQGLLLSGTHTHALVPLLRHSFLLSSRTVFMFSIHTASTGPSNSSHCLSGRVSCADSLKALASTPSFHSWLQGTQQILQARALSGHVSGNLSVSLGV